jgi:hypothetical protein
LNVYGKGAGTEFYSLAKKDVKKSLTCLIVEMTKDAKQAEVQVASVILSTSDSE